MTLKVGESYRGVFAYDPVWLGVTKIEMLVNGAARISYRVLGSRRIPRFLWRWQCGATELAAAFIPRLEEGAQMDRERAKSKAVKTVQEIEVRYR